MHRNCGLLPGTALTSSWNNEKKHNKSKSQEEFSRLRFEPAASQYKTKFVTHHTYAKQQKSKMNM
jgi:hypothetical protein